MEAAQTPRPFARAATTLNSPFEKAPGEGTGPTIHVDFSGNLVGRVPSRGEQDVFEQAANRGSLAASASATP